MIVGDSTYIAYVDAVLPVNVHFFLLSAKGELYRTVHIDVITLYKGWVLERVGKAGGGGGDIVRGV